MTPLSMATRLALVTVGSLVWLVGRRCWFIGDQILAGLAAFCLVALAACDVILWWPL